MRNFYGNASAVRFLAAALKSGKLSHAYLFTGPKGVGRLTLARGLAQVLNCATPQDGVPCGQCSACRRIEKGLHPDVQVLRRGQGQDGVEGAKVSIDAVRDLQHDASLQSYEGGWRVFIIDGAEELSAEAANALLKTLEEPPPRVMFILIAERPEQLPPTVRSRCQAVELTAAPLAEVRQALQERAGLAGDEAERLARLAKGRVGWALRAAATPDLLRRREEVLERIVELPSEGLEGRFAYAAELARVFPRDRERVLQELGLWQDWWHDLLLIKEGIRATICNVDYVQDLEAQARDLSPTAVLAFLKDLEAAKRDLLSNVSPRLALEYLMLHMPSLSARREAA